MKILLTGEIPRAHGHHDWHETLSVPQFDPSLGAIESVDLTLTMTTGQWFDFRNTWGVNLNIKTDWHLAFADVGVQLDDSTGHLLSLPPDPSNAFTGVYEFDHPAVSRTLPFTDFAALTGDGTLLLDVRNFNHGSWQMTAPSGTYQQTVELASWVSARADFDVTYTPEPEPWLALLLAVLLCFSRCRVT